jgi:hypothetical protein
VAQVVEASVAIAGAHGQRYREQQNRHAQQAPAERASRIIPQEEPGLHCPPPAAPSLIASSFQDGFAVSLQ